MGILPVLRGSSGLNNKIDQARLRYNQESGIAELAEAVNVYVDDSGRIYRRAGQTKLSAVKSHSVFCDKGDCFVVQDRTSDSAIYQVGTDFSLTGVRSSLAKGERVSFCQVGEKTYYVNGTQSGVITAGISDVWPTFTQVGATTTRYFGGLPSGASKLAHFDGCMWVVVEKAIYVSEPYAYGKFDYARRGFQFGTDVRMVKPVAGGVWVSDSGQTGFIAKADKFEAMSWDTKSTFPAHEWSECIELVDLSKTALEVSGLCAVWSSDEGLCVGTQDGQLIVTTKDKLLYPTGGYGATVADGHNIINVVY